MEERRRSIRLACSVLVEIGRADSFRWVGVCNDISEGGLRCESLQEPCGPFFKDGDSVSFVTILPVGLVDGTAAVSRVSAHSIALEFRQLTPESQERIRRFVRAPSRMR